jgi:hypothetical protein
MSADVIQRHMPCRDSPQRCHSDKRLELSPVLMFSCLIIYDYECLHHYSIHFVTVILLHCRDLPKYLDIPFLGMLSILFQPKKCGIWVFTLPFFSELWLSFWCEVHYNSLYAIEGEDFFMACIPTISTSSSDLELCTLLYTFRSPDAEN